MNSEARALASALDRTVRREIHYRQTLARAASAGTRTGLEQPEAANDARMSDARTVRVGVIVLVTVATLLALVALIA